MFLQDFSAKIRFLHILARFYTLKTAENWNQSLRIVYGSIILKFFLVAQVTHTHQWFDRQNYRRKKSFLGHPTHHSTLCQEICYELSTSSESSITWKTQDHNWLWKLLWKNQGYLQWISILHKNVYTCCTSHIDNWYKQVLLSFRWPQNLKPMWWFLSLIRHQCVGCHHWSP